MMYLGGVQLEFSGVFNFSSTPISKNPSSGVIVILLHFFKHSTKTNSTSRKRTLTPDPHPAAKNTTPWLTCSTEHHLFFSGKHSAMLKLMREDHSSTNIHHCLITQDQCDKKTIYSVNCTK